MFLKWKKQTRNEVRQQQQQLHSLLPILMHMYNTVLTCVSKSTPN